MKRMAFIAAVTAAILAVAWVSSDAAAGPAGPVIGAVCGPVEPQPRPPFKPEGAPGGPPGRRGRQGFQRFEQAIGRLYGLALKAAHETGDAELQRLVDQSLADRRAMIQEELNRLAAFEALVQAVRSGDKEAIQEAKEQLNQATAKLHAAGKKVADDIRAVVERLRELRPELMGKMQRRRQGMGPGPVPGRGRPHAPGQADVPPAVD